MTPSSVKYLTPFLVLSLIFVGCQDNPTAPSPEDGSETITNQSAPKASARSCDINVPDEYSTIQAAVDEAASGATVCVEDGAYTEQITINKNLALKGLNNPTIKHSSSSKAFTIPESGPTWEPIIFAYGGSVDQDRSVSGSETVNVTVKGFSLDGKSAQPDARRLPAIFYRNANGTVSDNTINNMAIGGNETFGILAYGNSSVDITGNTINGYERGGIGANGDGDPDSSPTVKIANNEITGSTGIGTAWGPNGIQVGYGAEGQVLGNVVKDNRYSKSDPVASCILVFESDNVSVKQNTVSNCDIGLSIGTWGWFRKTADGNQFMKNDVSNVLFGAAIESVAEPYGGALTSMDPTARNTKIVNNRFQQGGIGDPDGTSIALWVVTKDNVDNENVPTAENNKLIANQITGFDVSVDDQGSDTKAQTNDRPFTP